MRALSVTFTVIVATFVHAFIPNAQAAEPMPPPFPESPAVLFSYAANARHAAWVFLEHAKAKRAIDKADRPVLLRTARDADAVRKSVAHWEAQLGPAASSAWRKCIGWPGGTLGNFKITIESLLEGEKPQDAYPSLANEANDDAGWLDAYAKCADAAAKGASQAIAQAHDKDVSGGQADNTAGAKEKKDQSPNNASTSPSKNPTSTGSKDNASAGQGQASGAHNAGSSGRSAGYPAGAAGAMATDRAGQQAQLGGMNTAFTGLGAAAANQSGNTPSKAGFRFRASLGAGWLQFPIVRDTGA